MALTYLKYRARLCNSLIIMSGVPLAITIQPRLAGKAWLFDILLTRLASEQDAVVVANKVKSQLGYPAEPVLH